VPHPREKRHRKKRVPSNRPYLLVSEHGKKKKRLIMTRREGKERSGSVEEPKEKVPYHYPEIPCVSPFRKKGNLSGWSGRRRRRRAGSSCKEKTAGVGPQGNRSALQGQPRTSSRKVTIGGRKGGNKVSVDFFFWGKSSENEKGRRPQSEQPKKGSTETRQLGQKKRSL